MTGLTNPEIQKIVNRYIGVFNGYLSDFTHRNHSDFYPEYCGLEIDAEKYEGTIRKKFIAVLEDSSPDVQAKIVRGVLQRFPLDAKDKKPVTRNQELHDELVAIALRLEAALGISSLTSNTLSSEKEVFISYAWGGDSENFVNKLDKAFQTKGITIVRDKRDLGFKGLIKAFMEKIGCGKAIIAIISEKYLKSPNCMFELVEIAKHGNLYERIFPIVLEDANIYKPAQRIKYIRYWEEQIKELEEEMKTVGAANLPSFREDIDLYTEIRGTIDRLINILRDMNTLTPDIHTESNFEELFNAIRPAILPPTARNQPAKAVTVQPENKQRLDESVRQQPQKQLDQTIDEIATTLQPTDLNLKDALTWLYEDQGSRRAKNFGRQALERSPEAQTELLNDFKKIERFENELTNCIYRLHWAIFTNDFRPISEVTVSFDPEIYKTALDIIASKIPTDSIVVKERFQKHIQFFKKRLDLNLKA